MICGANSGLRSKQRLDVICGANSGLRGQQRLDVILFAEENNGCALTKYSHSRADTIQNKYVSKMLWYAKCVFLGQSSLSLELESTRQGPPERLREWVSHLNGFHMIGRVRGCEGPLRDDWAREGRG